MRTFAKQHTNKGTGIWGKRWTQAPRGRGISGAKNWVGSAGGGFPEHGVWSRMGRDRFLWGGGRRGAAGTYIPAAGAFLIPGSVTWYPGNVPCLLGGGCPAAHLPNPLVPLDDDMEMGCSLGTGLPLQGVWPIWHAVQPAVFSVGCLGKETREECGGRLGAVGAWEKWRGGGNASKACCLPRRGSGCR